jgi:hypothetical protein
MTYVSHAAPAARISQERCLAVSPQFLTLAEQSPVKFIMTAMPAIAAAEIETARPSFSHSEGFAFTHCWSHNRASSAMGGKGTLRDSAAQLI